MVIKSVQRELLNSLKGDIATEYSVRVSPEGEENETYLLVGSQPQLVANISLLMAFRQMLLNMDFAKVVGVPWEQYVTTHPAPCGIQIHWRLVKAKPWEPQDLAKKLRLNRKNLPRPQCYVQNIDTETLTWQKIKDATGGKRGYKWGRFYAHAKMVNLDYQSASSWNLTVFGGSEEIAVKQLKKMASLSKDTIGTLATGEQKEDEGRRKKDRQFRKPTVQIYPAWFFVNNFQLVQEAMRAESPDGSPVDYSKKSGRSTALGKQFRKVDAFYLNREQPTRDEVERLKEVLRPPRRNTALN
ncbi:hypothetical protein BI308_23165 [Roseofilum reptotaenium AO1-A]|uniref:Uncharacterized protein n=1 Tax=Roseofilum reptotaenium AO1-A TaxID=1925591 RepID=A0A1L9QKM3_9CYAN|nr:hypothetical protein BI308_23165 [Roseofilum reptotaenium AO1-A]